MGAMRGKVTACEEGGHKVGEQDLEASKLRSRCRPGLPRVWQRLWKGRVGLSCIAEVEMTGHVLGGGRVGEVGQLKGLLVLSTNKHLLGAF